MKNFITYRIAATLQLLVFFFIAVLCLRPANFMPANWQSLEGFDAEAWPSFFRMPVLMLMLITLLNDGTLISIGYDNVIPSKYPNVWNLRVVFTVASVLALVALLSSIIILSLCLDSWTPGSVFQSWGLGGLSYGQITTVVYLKVRQTIHTHSRSNLCNHTFTSRFTSYAIVNAEIYFLYYFYLYVHFSHDTL